MPTLTDRQQTMLEWLQTRQTASIEDIQNHFGVSPATAYRDARALVQNGAALKTVNGVKVSPPPAAADVNCAFCGGTINERSAFIFQLEDGTQRKACCPHCGLMALPKINSFTALAVDFLYGRRINVRQAVFLVESSVNLCCSPSVLCFASEKDARQFQAGFGGDICSLDEAALRISTMMSM